MKIELKRTRKISGKKKVKTSARGVRRATRIAVRAWARTMRRSLIALPPRRRR
jgi:hypothetical protein